jgi:hypothetical protein
MRTRFFATILIATPLAASCGSSTGPGTQPVGNVVLHDANNYMSTGALAIPVIETAAAADIQVCWNNLKKNLLCHDITSGTDTSIDNVGFAKIPHIGQMDVEMRLATGKDVTNLVATYGQIKTAQTTGGCTTLSALANQTSTANPTIVPATDYTEAVDSSGTTTTQYLMLFTHGTVEGAGAQGMVFIKPTSVAPGSMTTMVEAPDACASNILTFNATLGTTVSIPAAGPWKVDWSQLTKDSFGNPLDFAHTKVDKVDVGFYQGKTPADLQANFLDLDQPTFYTSLYSVAVPAGQKWVDLMGAKDAGGAALDFSRTDGTWAVAVLCSTCSVPAPVALTVLQVM